MKDNDNFDAYLEDEFNDLDAGYSDSDPDDSPLIDEIDKEIVLHRECHFSGHFNQMLDYYEREGKGVQPEFEIPRIKELAKIEENIQENLAPIILEMSDAEQVKKARDAYKKLRALYENETPLEVRLIADLILTEDPEASTELKGLVACGSSCTQGLIELLNSSDYRKSHFPGYGQAPALAAMALGLIGDEKAIGPLFEAIGSDDVLLEENAIYALRSIGEKAKRFLLNQLKSRPLNRDNERALIALEAFSDDPEVVDSARKELLDPEVKKDPVLSSYLEAISSAT